MAAIRRKMAQIVPSTETVLPPPTCATSSSLASTAFPAAPAQLSTRPITPPTSSPSSHHSLYTNQQSTMSDESAHKRQRIDPH